MGDIESAPFVEAMRQFQFRVGHENFALIHVSLVPDMHGEQKTKPTQATVHALRGLGLLADLVSLQFLSRIKRRIEPHEYSRLRAVSLAQTHFCRAQKIKFRCFVMSHPSRSSECTMSHPSTMFRSYCSHKVLYHFSASGSTWMP